jgi:hypothetical protein
LVFSDPQVCLHPHNFAHGARHAAMTGTSSHGFKRRRSRRSARGQMEMMLNVAISYLNFFMRVTSISKKPDR